MAASAAPRLTLSETDRATLSSWLRRRRTAQALALRARIVLACAEPAAGADSVIAKQMGVSRPTVLKWRQRFAKQGVDGLLDAPRCGAPRTILDEHVERVITTTLEMQPDKATHWSTRSLAAKLGMSQTAISRIWRAFALAPHRVETLQALHRSSVHREGARYRGAVPQSA
jgi:Transposase and inactivated derivatives